MKEYSGVTDDYIKACKEYEKKLNVPNLKYQIFNFMFLPNEIDEIQEVFEVLARRLNKEGLAVSLDLYKDYLDLSSKFAAKLNLKNSSTLFKYILKLANKHINDLDNIMI